MRSMNGERLAGALLKAPQLLPAVLAALLLATIAAAPALAQSRPSAECVPGRNLVAGLSPSEREGIETQAALVANGEGRLFRIERGGLAASHLFGTMHLSDPRVLALPAPVEEALAASDRFVVETLDIADEAKMAGAVLARPDLTYLPAGETLIDLVAKDRREEVAQKLADQSMPVEAVGPLQPWFVTVALATPACEAERTAEGAQVLDLALLNRARADGKALHGLETAVEQIEALASMPLELQADNLVATIDLMEELPDIFETMIALYDEGRIAMITTAIDRLAPSGTDEEAAAAIYTAFEERVVTRRNLTMAARLAPILDQGGAFVAVGALHLPGDEGLVELLRKTGWTVTRAD